MRTTITLFSTMAMLVAAALVWTQDPNASAQDARSPIVGAWFWENISDDPFDDSYAVFDSDGNYVEETSYIGAGIGYWESTGDRSGDVVIVYQDIDGGLDPDKPAAFAPGTITMWLALKIDESGGQMAASGPVEIRDTEGNLVDAFEFVGSARRLDLPKPEASPAP
jgi:hypothetical protein